MLEASICPKEEYKFQEKLTYCNKLNFDKDLKKEKRGLLLFKHDFKLEANHNGLYYNFFSSL